jgi:hypothetical protein
VRHEAKWQAEDREKMKKGLPQDVVSFKGSPKGQEDQLMTMWISHSYSTFPKRKVQEISVIIAIYIVFVHFPKLVYLFI